jgi:hypothetical protein
MIVDRSLVLGNRYMERVMSSGLSRPSSPASNVLLLIDGSVEDCNELSSKGWNVHVLLFDELIGKVFPAGVSVVQGALYSEWTKDIAIKCDAIVMGPLLGYVENVGAFLKKVHSLLTARGVIYGSVENTHYYQRLIDKSTREILPWPEHMPKGNSFTQAEIEATVSECELTIFNCDPVMDSLFYNEQYTHWQKVNGIDCQVMLPNEPEKRRTYFIKEFSLQLQNGSTEMITAANMVEGVDVEAVHKQVQAFLTDGQTQVVQGMLDTIIAQGRATDMTYNLYGVYYFYLGDTQKAYINFIDAIQKNAAVADYYRNLYDAAQSMGVDREVVVLLQSAVKQHPHLQSVLSEISQ